jgi:transcriptional regulator GlxA family with amidase domain
MANDLAMEMMYGDQLRPQQVDIQLSNLMIAVVDAFSEWRSFKGLRMVGASRMPDPRIRRAIGFMRANVCAELDIDSIASAACLSRAHFFKLFQQDTSLTPNLYVNVLRMEKAIEGLTQSRVPLVTLSESLGFSAQSHFTRFFQQHLGAMPSQYRKVVDVYDQH